MGAASHKAENYEVRDSRKTATQCEPFVFEAWDDIDKWVVYRTWRDRNGTMESYKRWREANDTCSLLEEFIIDSKDFLGSKAIAEVWIKP